MRGDVPDSVGLHDLAFGIDQVRPPLGPKRVRLIRMPLGLVQLPDLPLDVGQDPEREVVLLRERAILLGRVEGDPDELGAELLELWGSITEPPAFQRSPGGAGLHEPPEHHPPAPEIAQ
jgi:hypothetical protein